MDAFQILVIILSVFLAIFLLLGIDLLILAIRTTRKIKRITDNVEEASDSLRRLLDTLNQLASPVVIARVVVKYIRNYINSKRRSEND